MESGRGPESVLLFMVNTDRSLRFPMLDGMKPESRFESKYKEVKFRRFPMDSGIGPAIKFPVRDSDCRLSSWPMSEGMEPVSLLLSRVRWFKAERREIEAGIIPPIFFHLIRVKVRRYDRFPMDSDMLPLM